VIAEELRALVVPLLREAMRERPPGVGFVFIAFDTRSEEITCCSNVEDRVSLALVLAAAGAGDQRIELPEPS
jgi:hypothetical protein